MIEGIASWSKALAYRLEGVGAAPGRSRMVGVAGQLAEVLTVVAAGQARRGIAEGAAGLYKWTPST
jgi:hypothetical protein